MGRIRRRAAVIAGKREAQAIAATLGRDAGITRRRRRLTQAELGERVGLGQSEISHLERGNGARTSVETWVAIGMALGRPVAIGFSRDVVDPLPGDAGHLEAQELIVRVATAAGWVARVEVPSRPEDPRHSIDVVVERAATVVLVEIWNRLDDLGAALRSSDRKLTEAGGTAVRCCWALVDTAAYRAIVRRYPAVLRSRFGGPSDAWIRAIRTGAVPPTRPGLLWVDPRSATIRARRLPHAAG